MTPGGLRRGFALGATAALLLGANAVARAGQDAPSPCTVNYSAAPATAGGAVSTAFDVRCVPAWEITSVGQATTIQDPRPHGAVRTCSQDTPGATGDQACSLAGAGRLHQYLVTFVLTAYGNRAVCQDDGACDPTTSYTDPACATTPATVRDVNRNDILVTCTYRTVVAVGARAGS